MHSLRASVGSAFIFGIALGFIGACVPTAPVPCTECSGVCVDLTSSNANCGACGNACAPGQFCKNKVCETTCQAGATACNGSCVDTKSNPANCGACGTACPTGSACVAGSCQSFCASPRTTCNGACVDTQSDPANCGGCGMPCTGGQVCSAGQCKATCDSPLAACSGACVDKRVDPANCGTCGRACGANQACVAGSCQTSCSSPLTQCSANDAGFCADTRNDPSNCGGCGVGCDAGAVCSGGACQAGCSAPLAQCNGSCVNTKSDPSNCGGCGTTCDAGFCSNGSCQPTCPFTACSPTSCVNTQVDSANCGACGRSCDAGTVCSAGTCATSCGAGLSACNNACTNRNNDPFNCGTCGNQCDAGAVCSNGNCALTCNNSLTACASGACVATNSDSLNCGGCGVTCDAGTTCTGGACITGLTCLSPRQTCGSTCVDPRSDPLNCNGCGLACDAGSVCSGSACALSCGGGLTQCSSGSCVDTRNDPFNCGGCGTTCSPVETCRAGLCTGPFAPVLVSYKADGGLLSGTMSTDNVNVSANGRYVLFATDAVGIIPSVTTPPASVRVYLRDMLTGRIEVPTRLDGGIDVNGAGFDLSASGREISLQTFQNDIAPNDTNIGSGTSNDGFVINLDTNAREIVTVRSSGAQAPNNEPFVTWLFGEDARYVLFWSRSNYDFAGGEFRPYMRDRVAGTTVQLNVEPTSSAVFGCSTSSNAGANVVSLDLAPSFTKALWETAGNDPIDNNNCNDVHFRDMLTMEHRVVSSTAPIGPSGQIAVGNFANGPLFLSDTVILFRSTYPNLVTPDTNNGMDLFVKDLDAGTLTRVDMSLDGGQINGTLAYSAHTLSRDKRYFVFESTSTNLVPNDTNGVSDCFEYDFVTKKVRRINLTVTGAQATATCGSVKISLDGTFATYSTAAPMIPSDTNGVTDVYVQRLR